MRGVKFEASAETRSRVRELVAREKTDGLTASETAELDRYSHLEHLMRIAKAEARPPA